MKIGLAVSGEIRLSETFIRAHAERLPAEVIAIRARAPYVVGQPGVKAVKGRRLIARLMRKAGLSSVAQERTAAYAKAIRGSGADVLLAEYGTTGARLLESCERARIPLIVQFHGYDATRHDVLARFGDKYEQMFEQAAAIVVVSQAMRQQLASLGAPSHKLYYNPYGVDCEQFGQGEPEKAPPSFLAVGRFVEKKAPHLTLLAFAEVHKEMYSARLRMIGEGPLLDVCRDLAEGLGLTHAVTFLGPQPTTIVQEEMRQARAFVQHSVVAASGDSEGTPVAILEAGASGVPVVATRHAGIPDVVVEGETGLLVEERDVKGMAEQMLLLAQDAMRAGEMGAAARARVAAHFELDDRIETLRTILVSGAKEKSRLSKAVPTAAKGPVQAKQNSEYQKPVVQSS